MKPDFSGFLREHAAADLAESWQGAGINYIEVDNHNAAWYLHIELKKPLPAAVISQTQEKLLDVFPFLSTLEIIPALEDWEQGITSLLHIYAHENNNISKQEWNRLNWVIDGPRLDFLFEADWDFEVFINNQECSVITDWFRQEYNLRILTRALCTQPNFESCLENRHEKKALNVLALRETSKKKNQGKRAYQKSVPSADSVLIPISELQEGMKNIVVEGEIWHKESHLLKGGRYVISYFITDFRDSIMVKTFADNLEQDDIKPGQWLRISGSVRYDENSREIVLFMDAYSLADKPVRNDDAAEKRVELHAHTKMSAMDGLTEVKDLIIRAAEWHHSAIAITDHGCIQAFPEAFSTAKKVQKEMGRPIKVIYGVEGYLVENDRKESPYHIILLAQNNQGLRNLYELVSLSYLDYFFRHPKIPRAELIKKREGLLIGSACEAGEVYRAFVEGQNLDKIYEIANFYDYLEIQPLANNQFLIREGQVKDLEELQDINRRVVELGAKLGKPVCATGDVHFLEPDHEVFRRIIQAGQGYEDAETQAPLFLRNTEEMLQEFAYLGQELAREVVINNPNKVNDMIEMIKPIPDGFYPPKIEGSEEEIVALSWQRAVELYGQDMPDLVRDRIERELHSITTHGFSVLYLIAHKLVKKSNQDGYLVGSRGSVGSSLVAYLTGITEVNPLPPHWLCPQCQCCEFVKNSDAGCGVDLDKRICHKCGTQMMQLGFNIPFETFLGFEGDKNPDIDLNFSGDYQSRAHQYVEELFGRENVYRAGTISTIAEKTAYGFVKKYAEEKQINLRSSEMNRLAAGITGVRRTTGQHPGGLIVVPRECDINQFTPIQHPADNKESGVRTTHFDYHAIDSQLVKLDILGHDDPTVIKELEDLTGVKASAIPLNEEQAMKLFSGLEPLGLNPDDLGTSVGTFGIPEFGTRFVRQMLEATRPTTFSELIMISGLSHGTDVWLNNAQDLIENRTAALNEVISTRDDIMTYLINKGVKEKQAFDIMEKVRKGNGDKLKAEEISCMREAGVPEWYIESCRRIKYMFPKAHAVAYVMMAFRIAYFKVYYPREFYASFFSIRAEDFEPDTILNGCDAVKERIKEINRQGMKASQKDKKLLTILELAMEMYLRGLKFFPVDLYLSHAHKFLVKDGGLLLPFSALPGLGLNAAQSIVDARLQGEFLSVEELQLRAKINKTTLEVLKKYNCLESLPESTQLSLFA